MSNPDAPHPVAESPAAGIGAVGYELSAVSLDGGHVMCVVTDRPLTAPNPAAAC